jgi:hypothetical protein
VVQNPIAVYHSLLCLCPTVPSAPWGLRLELVGGGDPPLVAAEWQAPQHTHGPLRAYRLTYGAQGDAAVQERRIDVDKTRFTTGYLGECHCNIVQPHRAISVSATVI